MGVWNVLSEGLRPRQRISLNNKIKAIRTHIYVETY